MNRNAELFSYQLKKEKRRKVLTFILFIISLYIFINLLLSFIVRPVRQNSVSMIPDIPPKSVVMVSPVASEYGRGDVVLLKSRYEMQAGFLKKCLNRFVCFFTGQQISLFENSLQPSSKPHIRRIIGIPGDTIYMRDYVLYIKPQSEKHFLTEFEIASKTYNVTFYVPPADWNTELGVKGSFDEIYLGPNEYFVLADNRKSSDDSRLWGVVKKDTINAKVLMCYFPFKDFKIY